MIVCCAETTVPSTLVRATSRVASPDALKRRPSTLKDIPRPPKVCDSASVSVPGPLMVTTSPRSFPDLFTLSENGADTGTAAGTLTTRSDVGFVTCSKSNALSEVLPCHNLRGLHLHMLTVLTVIKCDTLADLPSSIVSVAVRT